MESQSEEQRAEKNSGLPPYGIEIDHPHRYTTGWEKEPISNEVMHESSVGSRQLAVLGIEA
jgi:hypothetical protein